MVVQEPSYSDKTAEAYYKFIESLKRVEDMRIEFFRPYRRNLIEELQEGAMSIVIDYVAGKVSDYIQTMGRQGFVARSLACDRLSVWCSEDHPLSWMKNLSLRDIESVPILSPSDTYSPIQKLVANYGKEHGAKLFFRMVESDRASTFLSMRQSDAIYILPDSVRNDIRSKARTDMVWISLEGGTLDFVSYAIMRKDEYDLFPKIEGCMNVSSVVDPDQL